MSSTPNISVIQRKECFVAPELQRNRKQVFDTLVLCSLIFSWGLSTKHFNLHTVGEYMTFPPRGSRYSIVSKCSYSRLFWLLSLKYFSAGIYITRSPHTKDQISYLLTPIVIWKLHSTKPELILICQETWLCQNCCRKYRCSFMAPYS